MCFSQWDRFYFSSCGLCSWTFCSVGQACTRYGMKIMRPDLPWAQVTLCITCFRFTANMPAPNFSLALADQNLLIRALWAAGWKALWRKTEVGWEELVLESRKNGLHSVITSKNTSLLIFCKIPNISCEWSYSCGDWGFDFLFDILPVCNDSLLTLLGRETSNFQGKTTH